MNEKNMIIKYGQDIISSDGMQLEKNFIQHGDISCFSHSLNVAVCCIKITKIFHIKVDIESMIRGALLHDYFLYDWHSPHHGLHGFTHADKALNNAKRDFSLNDKECDIIKKHMFPLNIVPPKYRESFIVCLSDKICAIKEMI